MKYLRPEILVRSNSRDLEEAVKAGDEWDAALQRYRRHLNTVKKRLPAKAVCFVDELFLHDSEFIGLNLYRLDPPAFGPAVTKCARAFVRTDQALIVIDYQFAVEFEIESGLLPERLVSGQPLWLYDEFDFDEVRRLAMHEVFLSNGSVIKFLFHSFDYAVFPLTTLPGTQRAEGRSDSLVTA
jgi:hypothetical protein